MSRLARALAALAFLCPLAAPPARAQLVGSFEVNDGPLYTDDPPTYSCVEACALLFGGAPVDYFCSTTDAAIDHTAWLDGYAADQVYCGATPGPETFKAGTTYNCGSEGCSHSAYVNDNNCNKTNYCFSALCGNGTVDAAEQCDDGNVADGDCCSSTCQYEPNGTVCSDGDVCNGEEKCGDVGDCQAGVALLCDDDNPCTLDACAPDVGCGIVAGQRPECNETAETAAISIDVAKEKLAYSAGKATVLLGDLGNPVGADGYSLCIFDGANTLQNRIEVGYGGTCDGKPCWKAVGDSGFAYKDKAGLSDGVKSLKVKASDSGKAKASLAASGEYLPDIPLPLVAPVVVQLANDSGACIETSFEAPEIKTNDATKLKGRHKGAAAQ